MTKYNIDFYKVNHAPNKIERYRVSRIIYPPAEGALGKLVGFLLYHGECQDDIDPLVLSLDLTGKTWMNGTEATLNLEVGNFITYDTETRECNTVLIADEETATRHFWQIPDYEAEQLNTLIAYDQLKVESERWSAEVKTTARAPLFAISPDYRQGHPTLPTQSHAGDAGYDLHAPFTFDLAPLQTATIDTGITAHLPKDHVGLVCPRSGLAAKHSVTVLNAPGVVDQGYTGTISVTLINHGHETVTFQKGDRIAQIVITPALTKHDGTDRNAGKHGSTGA